MATSKVDRQRVKELVDSGWTPAAIAEEVGCSERQVFRIRQQGYRGPIQAGTIPEDRLRALSRMVKSGATAKEISETLNMSRTTIYKYFPATKTGRTATTYNYERVAELTGLGWSAARIAEDLGCSERQVTRIRARLKISHPIPETAGKPLSPERYEAARKLADSGASISEISRTLKMSKPTIVKHFPEAKQNGDDWRHLWGQIRNNPKMRDLFDEMGGIT